MARSIAPKAQSLTVPAGSGAFRLLVAEAEAVLDADDQSGAHPEDDALDLFDEPALWLVVVFDPRGVGENGVRLADTFLYGALDARPGFVRVVVSGQSNARRTSR